MQDSKGFDATMERDPEWGNLYAKTWDFVASATALKWNKETMENILKHSIGDCVALIMSIYR